MVLDLPGSINLFEKRPDTPIPAGEVPDIIFVRGDQVGINTKIPTATLEVNGDIKAWNQIFEEGIWLQAGNFSITPLAIGADQSLRVTSKGAGTLLLNQVNAGNVAIGTHLAPVKLNVNGAIASKRKTITASSDATDVNNVNTVFINPAAAVSIGAFVGGVVGQVLNVVIIDDDQNVTIQHNKGTGNQNIFIHAGADETLDSHFGGWIFVCDGSNWYGTAHERHS